MGHAEGTSALLARASVFIKASNQAIWDALISPDSLKRVMPIVQVVSGFRAGEPFEWIFDMAGHHSRVNGVVRQHLVEARGRKHEGEGQSLN